jgi:hypothetical protein
VFLVAWLQAAAPLLVLALLRLLPRGEEPRRAERIAVATAAAVAAWNVLVVGGWFLAPASLTASDFGDYCGAALAVAHDRTRDFPATRSRVAAWLPGALVGRVGVIDALWLGAALPGAVCLHAGVYLWARALHSRAAAVAAVVAVGLVGPVVAMGRVITFYPPLLGTAALATGLGVASVRWPRAAFLAAGAVATAALPLLDVRGILWVPAPLLLLVAGAIRAGTRVRVLAAVVLVAAFEGSWWLGRVAYSAETTGLEGQAWHYTRDAARFAGVHLPGDAGSGFVWGRSDVRALPGTFARLRDVADALPDEARSSPQAASGRSLYVFPVGGLAIAAGLVAIAALRREPARAFALVVSVAPYVVTTLQAALVVPLPRHLAAGLAGLPALVGVAGATLAGAGEGGRWRALALVAWLVLLSSRVLPPIAPFLEVRTFADEAPTSTVWDARDGAARSACAQALVDERARGGTGDSRIFPTR